MPGLQSRPAFARLEQPQSLVEVLGCCASDHEDIGQGMPRDAGSKVQHSLSAALCQNAVYGGFTLGPGSTQDPASRVFCLTAHPQHSPRIALPWSRTVCEV